MGERPEEPVEKRMALILWLKYHTDTEEFDRTLAGHWSKNEPDCWLPVDLELSRIYADGARKLMKMCGDQLNIDTETMNWAQQETESLTHREATRLLEHLTQTQ